MNRLTNNSKEGTRATSEPHTARRAIRYRAADNAKSAIARQFPGIFAARMATAQVATPYMQPGQEENNASQAA